MNVAPGHSPRAPAGGWLLREQPECKHTPHPTGYIAFHEWANKKSKTHTQHRCPVCGLWAIWKSKRCGGERTGHLIQPVAEEAGKPKKARGQSKS